MSLMNGKSYILSIASVISLYTCSKCKFLIRFRAVLHCLVLRDRIGPMVQ